MGVVVGRAGQVVIHDDRELHDIESSRREVGRDEDLNQRVLEIEQHQIPRPLAEIPVEGERADAIPPQLVGDMIGGVLSGDKNENALPAFGRDEVAQQGRPFRLVDANRPLCDRRSFPGHGLDFDPHRFVEDLGRERLHCRRKGRGEEQILPLFWKQCQDLGKFIREPRIEHAIRLIKDERLHRGKSHRILIHEIEQSSRRRDDDVGASAQRHHLGIDRDAADGTDDLDPVR